MIFPGGEIYQISAVQFECGHLIANCLYSFRRRFSYCLPYFFKDDLDILRKGFDVFIYRFELFFVVIHINFGGKFFAPQSYFAKDPFLSGPAGS